MQQAASAGFRLSPQQQHVWWAQLGEHSAAFVVQARIDVTGPLDRARLAAALAAVVERHEILRTAFPRLPGLGIPVQAIAGAGAIDWRESSLTGLPAALRQAALDRLCDDVRELPFDLAQGPLVRAILIVLGGERHALLVTQPPLAADGPSLDLLAADTAAAYHGRLAGEALQYADLAEILHEWQGSPAEEAGPAFWRDQDLSALVRVPAGPAGLPDGQPFRPRRVRRHLGRAAIEEAAARLGTPLWQLLLAGWMGAIHASTGEEELVVGVLFDGRTCEEFRGALGPFARYVPVRGRAAADSTLAELCGALADTLANAARRQDFFSSEPVERLLAQHGATGWPFGFDYRQRGEPAAVPGSPRFAIGDGYLGLDRFGVRLSVLDDGRSLRAELTYDPALVRPGEAGRSLERLARVLDGLLAGSPLGEIEVLTDDERRELLALDRTETAVPAGLLAHQLFEEQARRAPDALAVVHAGCAWTYGELDARANRLARWMCAAGLGPGSFVGLCLQRSPELVAAVLGTLKAGAAYVPLDPGAPAERLAWMAEDAGLSLLLTRESLLPLLSGEDGEAPPPVADPADLAYVIYTSGSTGRPKGVMIAHRGLVNYLLWARQTYGAGEGAGAPVHSAIGFDLTVTSLLVPLAAGTAVTLVDEGRAVEALAGALRGTGGFSLVKLTPAHLDVLNAVLAEGELAGRARVLVIGGEALRGESVAPWREHAADTRLINEYGPTEATVGCCVHQVVPDDPQAGAVAIGHAIANTRLHVVGRGMRRVPLGAPGELWIGGDGLARGYLGRPELTAERFVPDPFAEEAGRAGERLYRTGDLVRRGRDSGLEFLGRVDGQLKIRGFRIEPGEIEAVLAAHPKVRECVVLARETQHGKQLVACVVPRSPAGRPAAAELRRQLEERLPDYMVPSFFAVLESLPLTPNGKVDRRALLASGLPEHEETPYAPPRTLVEEVLAEIWMELLGMSRVGIDDPFFSLGGDSIRSLQVIALARKRGLAMTLQDLFQRPTIRRLAQVVRLDGVAPEAESVLAPFALIAAEDRERLDAAIEDAYPLARLQAGMLFHSELAPASAIYHDLHSFHLRAPLEPGRMREALRQVSLLHPMLRTSFDLGDFREPLQLVHAGVTVPLEVYAPLRGGPDEQAELLSEWLAEERRRGFDWTRPPLVAFHVHPRGEESFQITLSFHHAVLDGWSAATLLTDLFRRYALLLRGEQPPSNSPPEVAYRDFVALERAARASPEARSFWGRMLDGAEPARLPRLAPAAGRTAAVREIHRPIDPALSDAAHRMARRAEVPLKSLLLALHVKVAGLLGGTRDVLTGLVSHGRPEHPDSERILGLFLNTLPFRIELHAGSWRDLAREVFDLERRMLPFRRFPFADMRAPGGGRPGPEIVYSYLHFHVYQATMDVHGTEVLGRYGYEETNFPLVVNLSLDPFSQQLRLDLSCRTPDLDPLEAERFADFLLRALEAATADAESPHDALSLSAAERQQLLDRLDQPVDRLPVAQPRSPGRALVAPRTPVEEVLVEIWAEILGTGRVGVRDSFFDLGGHSLTAVHLMARIKRRLGRTLPLTALFEAPTVEALAALLSRPGTEIAELRRPAVVVLKPEGGRPPFFCVHPVGGNVLCYLDLARHLPAEQPFYGLQTPGAGPASLEEIATRYLSELRRVWPRGPYRLGGWSLGGLIAFEMARQLAAQGEQPELVALIDTLPPAPAPEPAQGELVARFAEDLGQLLGGDLGIPPERLRSLARGETLDQAVRQAHAAGLLPEEVGVAQIAPLFATFAANLRAGRSYDPGPYPGRLTLWMADATLATVPDLPDRWGRLALAGLETSTLMSDHYGLLRRPAVERLAGELAARLGLVDIDDQPGAVCW